MVSNPIKKKHALLIYNIGINERASQYKTIYILPSLDIQAEEDDGPSIG